VVGGIMAENKFIRFGKTIFKIASKLAKNQNICRLLVDTSDTPIQNSKTFDGLALIRKNIILKPKVPYDKDALDSKIVVLIDEYVVDEQNPDFNLMAVRFDVICPIDTWDINEVAQRPFMLMAEIDEMFNGARVTGLGKLTFSGAKEIVPTDYSAGYTMYYACHEFD
jgi:hypothetical protein